MTDPREYEYILVVCQLAGLIDFGIYDSIGCLDVRIFCDLYYVFIIYKHTDNLSRLKADVADDWC